MQLTSIESLGSGGFGNVDLVEDENGVRYARKTFSVNQPLPETLVPNVRKRFVREAKLQSGISHRNIVPILHVFLDGDEPWYLMPVAESTLEKDIAQDKTLSGKYPAAISNIVAGLEELHGMEMFHRDLKPQNVLRFIDDATGEAYYAISDFGFVSLKDSRLSKLTLTGMAKGTDYYTAPEITKDLKNASAQSDIYSLGCILHDMLGTEDRVPCGEIREDGDFGALLLNCTRGKPDRRFKSVAAVRDVLLSIDVTLPAAQDAEAISLSEQLDSDEDLTAAALGQLAEFLEDHSASPDAQVLLRKMTIDRIRDGWTVSASDMKRIGIVFAEWSADNSFDFEYCDVLADRLVAFFDGADLHLKAECLRSLLSLGTSHNRWYVERRFTERCGPLMDEGLARRLAVEFRAGGEETCQQVSHLEFSIDASRSSFHPTLVKALDEICP